jgi:ribonuclease E
MLFNATQSEEVRVAIINDNIIEDLDYEHSTRKQRKSNIYKGKITRVEPSLEAAFVNYGVDRHGFLPFKEISKEFYSKKSRKRSLSITDVVEEGQEVVVQVSKEERGNKGAALTTFLSLAGRYIVLMPNNSDSGGISRRIEGDERTNFKEILSELKVTKGMSVIGRTAGIGITLEEIQWDLNYLTQLWDAIIDASSTQQSPFLIYQESNLVIRAIRDYFHPDIEEILIDNQEIFDQASQFMNHVMPDYAKRIEFYQENTSLFSKYNIEKQIESAFTREVQLPSGGVIVIDHTEALVSVDVNSSRSTKGRDIENTAFSTNMEAAKEIAKQLRLRDIGGLIVVDFIDMENTKHQREIEDCMRESLKNDKARIQTGRISRFGLMELSRQRLRPSIGETSNGECPKCNGTGRIRDLQSSALHIMRLVQDESNKKKEQRISVQVPVEVATYLLNEKRELINNSEQENNNKIFIIANKYYEVPQYKISSNELTTKASPSFQEVEIPENKNDNEQPKSKQVQLKPAVKGVIPEKRTKKNKSIFGFIKGLIDSSGSESVSNTKPQESITENQSDISDDKSEKPNFKNNRRRSRNFKGKSSRNSSNPQMNVSNSEKKIEKNNLIDANEKPKIDANENLKKENVTKNLSKPKNGKAKSINKTEELKDINLKDVGLTLVETSKSSKTSKADEELIPKKKLAKAKPAAWAKTKKSSEKKGTSKLVMIETKATPKAKPKKPSKAKPTQSNKKTVKK